MLCPFAVCPSGTPQSDKLMRSIRSTYIDQLAMLELRPDRRIPNASITPSDAPNGKSCGKKQYVRFFVGEFLSLGLNTQFN